MNITVLCTFEEKGKLRLQIFRGSAAGAAQRNLCRKVASISGRAGAACLAADRRTVIFVEK